VADLNKFLGGTKMKLKDQRDAVRGADEGELREALDTAQIELLNLQTQAMMQQMPNPLRIRQVRKMVARINQELHTRKQAAA
jgi:ribosomal protein L29